MKLQVGIIIELRLAMKEEIIFSKKDDPRMTKVKEGWVDALVVFWDFSFMFEMNEL